MSVEVLILRKELGLYAACLLSLSVPAFAQQKGVILEEVVARVNAEVITQGDLAKAAGEMRNEAAQDCPACTPAQLDDKLAGAQKDILRDLIDNSLLVQRAKDMGISVETDVVKRLDEIRIQNKIASMEDLEKEVTKSGVDFEDFKNNIRNQLLQQEAIRKEIGSRIIIDHAQVLAYYEEHKSEFVHPEQVAVREIFVSTDGKSGADADAAQKKADGLLTRVKNGDDFGELAKRFSDGSTAKEGGELGVFEHGQLAPNLEAIAFKMKRNDVTDVMPTKSGLLILQVQEHYPAGQQPEDKVDNEITSRLYNQQMKTSMRDYLKTLREDSFVEVKPGYVDSAAVESSAIEERPASDDTGKKKKGLKLDPFSRKKNGA